MHVSINLYAGRPVARSLVGRTIFAVNFAVIVALSGAFLTATANAQSQASQSSPKNSSPANPTLGQLSDAQAFKAREEYLKSLALTPTSSGKTAPANGSPVAVPPLAGVLPQSGLPVAMDKSNAGLSAPQRTTKIWPSYAVVAIYGPVNNLNAQVIVDGKASVVRGGDRINAATTVQTISAEAVTLLVTPDTASTKLHKTRKGGAKASKEDRADMTAITKLTLRPGETKP